MPLACNPDASQKPYCCGGVCFLIECWAIAQHSRVGVAGDVSYLGSVAESNERLSRFVDNKTYLTPLQEHDLVALTASYAAQLDMEAARNIVKQDTVITNEECQVLLSAIDLYRSSVSATCAALGNPRWVES